MSDAAGTLPTSRRFLLVGGVALPLSFVLSGRVGMAEGYSHDRIPRLSPLPQSQWDRDTRALLVPPSGFQGVQNIFSTLVRNKKLFAAWAPYGRYSLYENTLEPRLREAVVLRTAWRARASYDLTLTREARLSLGYEFRAENDDLEGFASDHQVFLTLSHDFTLLP